MCPQTGGDEADLLERLAIDQEDPVGMHIRDEEYLPVGRDADVLWHAALGEFEKIEDAFLYQIDFDQAAAEFASKDGVAAIDREIAVIDARALRRPQRPLQHHAMRIPKIQSFSIFRDNDRRTAVGQEVHV